MFTRYHLSEMMTVDFCCCFKCIYCCHIITYQIIMIALRHWSDILITVQSSASFTVRIAVEIFFLFISVVYVDTATAWSNDSPFFFLFLIFFHKWILAFALFFFSPSYPTYLIPFCFVDFCFWRQQVGIDQGDIPDLSQVSVHLTFHFFFTPFHLFFCFPLTLHKVSLLPLGFCSPPQTMFHHYI